MDDFATIFITYQKLGKTTNEKGKIISEALDIHLTIAITLRKTGFERQAGTLDKSGVPRKDSGRRKSQWVHFFRQVGLLLLTRRLSDGYFLGVSEFLTLSALLVYQKSLASGLVPKKTRIFLDSQTRNSVSTWNERIKPLLSMRRAPILYVIASPC
jgi:hypothetical protein